MTYLGWYDPAKTKSAADKLSEAITHYEQKWGARPSVALVNQADVHERDDIALRVATTVAPNTFYVGEDEPA